MPNAARVSSPPPKPPAGRPPHVLQVVRNVNSPLLSTPVDWSHWYLLDEDDMGHSLMHGLIAAFFVGLLERWVNRDGQFRGVVQGDVFFQWVPGEPNVQISPDAFVVDAVPEPPPDALQTWLPGHLPPRFAVEIVSKAWRKDYDDNPPKYAHLGTRELVIYDHLHVVGKGARDRHALQVFRRTSEGAFGRVYAGPGPAYSAELDAWLVDTGNGSKRRLRLARDPAGKDLVLSGDEAAAAAEKVAAQAEHAAAQAEDAAARAEHAAAQAEHAAAQAEQEAQAQRTARLAAEAELAKLREELAKLRGQ